jgi:hypothetical protein
MWRELIQAVCAECKCAPPAAEEVLTELETALGVAVPPELRALWLEANGVGDQYGDGIWSVEQTIRDNLEFRSYPEQNDLYMPFDHLLFFAGAGNGDQFFFPIQADGGIHRPDIFVWDHETDSRKWVAGNLERWVEQWYAGKLAY